MTIRKLSRREFQEIIHEHAGREGTTFGGGKMRDREVLEVEWCSGGLQGGNCWGDDASIPVEGDVEPPFNYLDNVLLEICPQMGFLQYKTLCNKIKFDTRSENEYYGNHSIYSKKSLKVDDLWIFLIEHNLIKEDGSRTVRVFYTEIYKNRASKRRSRALVIATSEADVHNKIGHMVKDGYFLDVEWYDQSNEVHRKEFNKLSRKQQAEYTPYM